MDTQTKSLTDFFVSYDPSDLDAATELSKTLTRGGSVVDSRSLFDGEDWDGMLAQQLKTSRFVVALLSGSSREAEYQRRELEQALKYEETSAPLGRVIPVFLNKEGQDASISFPELSERKAYSVDDEGGIDRVAEIILGQLQPEAPSEDFQPVQKKQSPPVQEQADFPPKKSNLTETSATGLLTGAGTILGTAFMISRKHAVALATKLPLDSTFSINLPGNENSEAIIELQDETFGIALVQLKDHLSFPQDPLEIAIEIPGEGEPCQLDLPSNPSPNKPATRTSVTGTIGKWVEEGSPPVPLLKIILPESTVVHEHALGSPILVNDEVVAILSRSEGNTLFALPVTLLRSHIGFLPHLENPPAPPEVEAWVCVAGGTDNLSSDCQYLAQSIGLLLARRNVGIITGGFEGIDAIVAQTFVSHSVVEGKIPAVQLITEGSVRAPIFDRFQLTATESWAEGTVAPSDFILILDGGPNVKWLADIAWRKGKLVLALPCDSEEAQDVHKKIQEQWSRLGVPGIDAQEHLSIPSLPFAKKSEIASKVVDRVLSGAGLQLNLTQVFPDIPNDGIDTKDCLNVEWQANIFAKVIASKSLTPPLAIGLFGDWGSGKSYFMDLMQKAVSKESKKPDNWPQICQIEFNAWHYLDADLWASLAGRIFDEIAEHIGKDETKKTNPDNSAVRQKLRERLRSTHDAREQASEAELAAANRLSEIQEELNQREKELEQSIKDLSSITNPRFWKALRKSVDITQEEAIAAARRLGLTHHNDLAFDEALETPEEIQKVVAEIRTLSGRISTLWNRVSVNKMGWLIGLAAVLGGPALIKLLGADIDLSSSLTWIVQATTGIASVVAWLTPKLTSMGKLLDLSDTVSRKGTEIQEEVLDELKNDGNTDQLRKDRDTSRALVETTRAKKRDLEKSFAQIQGELEALHAGKLVYDFVLEKTADEGTYRSREGIVSTVRRDLKTLAHLLQEWKKDEPSPEGPTAKTLKKIGEDEVDKLPIQRIILYIDDLDRCSSDRVEEVLQAVHLLLAFDLFVAVVGVDARWLERSLKNQLGPLLGKSQAGEESFSHRAASAQDYLEKIFQVPFTLPRVQDDGFADMMKAHFPLVGEQPVEDKPETEVERQRQTKTEDKKKTVDTVVAKKSPDEPRPKTHTEEGAQKISDASSNINTGEVPQQRTSTPATTKPGQNDPARKIFYIEPWERAFMESLGSFIATPRLIKRFVAVYRLLRVGVPKEKYESFLRSNQNNRHAGHRAVQVLLAINIGFPHAGSVLLRALAWPNELPKEVRPESFPQFLSLLGDQEPNSLRTYIRMYGDAPVELEELLPLLERVKGRVPEALDFWTEWAPKVGRYSMYWQGR